MFPIPKKSDVPNETHQFIICLFMFSQIIIILLLMDMDIKLETLINRTS
jgi:hypothetical protein